MAGLARILIFGVAVLLLLRRTGDPRFRAPRLAARPVDTGARRA